MKDTYYFSHDYNARQDDKIKCLLMKHGMLGYGLYWAIVENLYNNANALRLDCEIIAYELRTTENVINSIINDFDLFVINDGLFGSLSVQRRLEERNNKSQTARESAFKRWSKNKIDANAMQTQCDSNAIKERKGKDIKEIKINETYTFDEFWNDYNKKVDTAKCKEKFSKLSDADKMKIKETLPFYLATIKDKQFQKNPKTYLNGKCWDDEISETIKETPETKKEEGFKNPYTGFDFSKYDVTEANLNYFGYNVCEDLCKNGTFKLKV